MNANQLKIVATLTRNKKTAVVADDILRPKRGHTAASIGGCLVVLRPITIRFCLRLAEIKYSRKYRAK